MKRFSPLLVFVAFLAFLVATGLAVRLFLYPRFADSFPWPVDDEEPDEEHPEDPDAPPFGIASTYQVHFIDSGHGEAVFVRTPSKNILINAGLDDRAVSEFLQHLETDTLNLLVITDPHSGTIGGLPAILRQYHVLEIIDPGIVHTTDLFTSYLELADSLNIPFITGASILERELGDDVKLTLLQPTVATGLDNGAGSIYVHLQLRDLSIFLAGSSDRHSEMLLLAGDMLYTCQVMLAGNQNNGPSDAILNALKPETAVLFCSSDLPHSLPDPVLLKKMYQRNIAVYQSCKYGTITIHTDGEQYYIETTAGGIEEMPGQGGQAFTRVDLNAADYEELLRIVHIGPARAQQIIAMRPLGSLEDLIQIPGIDLNRLEEIRMQNLAFVK